MEKTDTNPQRRVRRDTTPAQRILTLLYKADTIAEKSEVELSRAEIDAVTFRHNLRNIALMLR
jgi:hypothetical protein